MIELTPTGLNNFTDLFVTLASIMEFEAEEYTRRFCDFVKYINVPDPGKSEAIWRGILALILVHRHLQGQQSKVDLAQLLTSMCEIRCQEYLAMAYQNPVMNLKSVASYSQPQQLMWNLIRYYCRYETLVLQHCSRRDDGAV
jgi:hypothetical protein